MTIQTRIVERCKISSDKLRKVTGWSQDQLDAWLNPNVCTGNGSCIEWPGDLCFCLPPLGIKTSEQKKAMNYLYNEAQIHELAQKNAELLPRIRELTVKRLEFMK